MEEREEILGGGINDVIFPDAHLCSPLVLNKLMYYLTFARIRTKHTLCDNTLVDNINHKLAESTLGTNRDVEEGKLYRRAVRQAQRPGTEYSEIIYPDNNHGIFRFSSINISRKFRDLCDRSTKLFTLIAPRLMTLLSRCYTDLGSDPSTQFDSQEGFNETPARLADSAMKSTWYVPFGTWFQIKTWMRKAIKNTSRVSRSLAIRPKVRNFKDVSVVTNGNMVTVINHELKWILHLTFEMCLAITDTLEGRLMIDISTRVDPKYADHNTRGKMLWEGIDTLFIYLGNKTYDIVALLEPLSLSLIQMWDGEIHLRGAFLQHCLGEVKGVLREAFSGAELEQITKEVTGMLLGSLRGSDPSATAEMFSFFRTFSHPTLEAASAAKKVRQHMNKSKTIRLRVLQEGHAMFCAMIINGYRDRNGGVWPPCKFPLHASPGLLKYRDLALSIPYSEALRYYRSFSGFHFEKFIDPKVDDDLTMYMKDKALAPDKEYWDSIYMKGGMMYIPRANPGTRRLVEKFVDDEEFDPFDILEYVTSGEFLRDTKLNCSYSLKEKEVKKHGRLFAKVPYKMRAAQVMAEHFIAGGVGTYFRENAMVKDEQSLLKSIYQISISSVPKEEDDGELRFTSEGGLKSMSDANWKKKGNFSYADNDPGYKTDRYETVSGFITTDLEKFCLNWRYETTRLFAARLDEIYGLDRFFDWHHRALEEMTLYVGDPFNPPPGDKHISIDDAKNSGIFIKNPLGGIEGYCQKMWTIITVAYLQIAALKSGRRIEALVQGDNQAIAVTTRVPATLPDKEKKRLAYESTVKYFMELRDLMWGIGHNLKLNETLISTHFFVFSKKIYYDGVVLSQALKPLSRCCFWSETLVDETRSACSTLATTISKAIENGFSPVAGYLLLIFKNLQQLLVSLSMSINTVLTRDITTRMLDNDYKLILAAIIPSQTGGFNYLSLPRIFVRNIGDPMTTAFGDIKRMIRAELLPPKILIAIFNQQPGDSDWLDWGSDPYSGNLPDNQSITTSIKNLTGRFVLKNAKNPVLKGLFTEETEQQDRDIAEFLLNRDIIVPRVASEILDSSIVGAREEIASMVDTTKTLVKTALKLQEYSSRFITKLNYHDYRQFEVFLAMIENRRSNIPISTTICSVSLAIAFRSKMWAKLAKLRPIQGLETPDILEFSEGHFIDTAHTSCKDRLSNKEYAFFYVPANCQLDAVIGSSRSIRVPYLGSTTEERSEIKVGNLKNLSRPAKKAIRTATVYTWGFGDSDESWEAAHALASTRAEIGIDDLRLLTPISTSTNLSHRLRDKQTQMKYSSTKIPRVSRYTTISNDKLNFTENESTVDTNIIYQQIMLLGLSVLEDTFRNERNTGPKTTIYHLHARSNCCVRVQKDNPSNPARVDLNLDLSQCENKLIYDPDPINAEDKKHMHEKRFHLHTVNFNEWPDQHIIEECTFATAATVVNIMANNESSSIKTGISLDHSDGVNGLISEFLACDLIVLWTSIGQIFLNRWIYQLGQTRPTGKTAVVESISDTLDRMSTRILGFLKTVLTHNIIWKRHIDLGLLLPIYGHLKETQDMKQVINSLMLDGVRMALDQITSGVTPCYRIFESDPDLINAKLLQIKTRHLMTLFLLYRDGGVRLVLYGKTEQEKYSELTELITRTQIYLTLQTVGIALSPNIKVYPTSITYVRRGTLKVMRLRGITPSKMHTDTVPTIAPYDSTLHATLRPKQIKYAELCVRIDGSTFGDISSEIPEERNYPLYNGNGSKNMMLRTTGINSTSHYKMNELFLAHAEWFRDVGEVMTLGEGSGAMASFLLAILPSIRLWFNTGIAEDTTQEQRVRDLSPSEVEIVDKIGGYDGMLLARMVKLFNGHCSNTWIGGEETTLFIREITRGVTMGVITYDGEGGTMKKFDDIWKEHVELIKIASDKLGPEGTLITKISVGDTNNWLKLLRLYTVNFSEVLVHALSWSNPRGGEFYLSARYPARMLDLSTIPYVGYGMTMENFSKLETTLMRLKYHSEIQSERMILRLEKQGELPEHDIMMALGFLPNLDTLLAKIIGTFEALTEERAKEVLHDRLIQTKRAIEGYKAEERKVLFEHYAVNDSTKVRDTYLRFHMTLLALTIAGHIKSDKWSDHTVPQILNRSTSTLEWGSLRSVMRLSKEARKWLKTLKQPSVLKIGRPLCKAFWKVYGGSKLPKT